MFIEDITPRRAAIAACVAGITLATTLQASDWTFYRKDLPGTANAGEPLTLAQASALEVSRMIFLGGSIFSNPIVANGNLYYTAGDGYIHAVSLTDYTSRWQKAIYATGPFHCLSSYREPPVGAPAVVGTTIFVPGGDGVVYSLDQNGNQNWATKIADVNNLGEFLWSSIFPLNGKIYVGVASLHDCLLVPGRLVALDQASGAVVGTWWGDANHGPGAGIWTQPAYDAVSNRLFLATGTIAPGKTTAQQPWADAFVAINPDTMVTLDSFSPIPSDNYYADLDFGSSPTLYDSPDGRHFIAATDKNGWVYALDRDNLAGGVVWKYQICGPGASPDLGESSIVSAPYANGTLFVAGGKTADGLHPGAVAALDAFTGAQKWIFYPEGFVLPAMTVTGQVLFVGSTDPVSGRGTLYALDQATGTVVYQLASAAVFGQPTWANGSLYVGDGVGSMFELTPNSQGPRPDFDLTVDRLTTTTTAGGTATASISAVPKNGFTAPVSVTVSSNSATASVSPTTLSPSASATLSLATSAATGVVYETATITATGGGRTRATAVWLVVSDFALKATAATATPGSSASSTITVVPKNGFTSAVDLGVSGLPAGTTASFSTTPATSSSTLTLQTSSATPAGTYQVQVTGTVGTLSHVATVQLAVTDFALSASAANVVQGTGATSTVTIASQSGFASPVSLSVSGLPAGTTATFDPNPATTSSTLTLQTSSASLLGTYQVQVSGVAGSLTRNCTLPLAVAPPPDFQVAVDPPSLQAVTGGQASYTVTIPTAGSFAQQISLSVTGLPPGATYSFGAAQNNSQVLTVTLAPGTPTGPWTFSVLATAGGVTRVISASLAVTDFDLTLSQRTVRVEPGRRASVAVAIAPKSGFNAPVQLQITGLPPGATASWSSQETSSSSTLTVDVSSAAALGTYSLTVGGTASGASHSTQLSLEIQHATGCGSGGSANLGAALVGLYLMALLSRRRQGAQRCAALERSVVRE